MDTLKKYSRLIILALSVLLFILCIWGPFMHDPYVFGIDENGEEFEGKTYSFSEYVEYSNTKAKYVASAKGVPGMFVFLMYAVPLICVAASAVAAFKPTFYPKATSWVCRIAAIIIALYLLYVVVLSHGIGHGMLYFDALIAILIAAGSFIYHKQATA